MQFSPFRLQRSGLWVVFGAALALSVYLRAHDVTFPAQMSWDENHFVENARNYLVGQRDWNDHPPLGKLIIALGMAVIGDNALGWRIAPLLLGLVSIPLAGLLARRLYPGLAGAAPLAMVVVGLDGFLICYSRTALLDGMLTTLYLAALALMVSARGWQGWCAVFLTIAAACSIKWSGVALLMPLATLLILQFRPAIRHWPAALVLPLAYVTLYSAGLWFGQQPWSLADFWQANRNLLAHHLGLTGMTHSATSYWYSWLYMGNPIVLRYDAMPDGSVAVMSSMSNPVLWFGVTLAALASSLTAVVRWRELFRRKTELNQVQADTFLVAAWVAPILPWILTARDSYIYHYLPAYAAGLVLLSAWAARLFQRLPSLTVVVGCVLLVLSLYFAPVSTQWPISPAGFEQRMWLEGWR